MKMINLLEQTKFLYNEESVSKYLKTFNYDVGKNNENFTIFNSNKVNLNKNIIFDNLNEELKIELGFCTDIALKKIKGLSSLKSFLPVTAINLIVDECDVAGVLDITTLVYNNYINIIKCNNLVEILTISPALFIDACDSINSVYFNGKTSKYANFIVIKKCKNVMSFSDIKTNNGLSRLIFVNTGLNSYKNFNLDVDELTVSYEEKDTIKDFSYIENVQPKKRIFLTVFKNHTAHIINLLMLKTETIHNDYKGFNNDSLITIMDEFISKNNNERSEYIMDCALQLLDAGYEAEAEA